MKELSLTNDDQELIDCANKMLQSLYKKQKHGVAATIRCADGSIYSAVHLEGSLGRTSVCAEVIALGKAISEGKTNFSTIVAVWFPNNDSNAEPCIAPPCGICRELLIDYAPQIEVITQEKGRKYKTTLDELLPNSCHTEF